MKILTATTEAAARALEDKADEFLRASVPGYEASRWSDIYTDGTRFGIAFESRLVPAFTAAELGTQTTGSGEFTVTTYANVINAQMATETTKGWSTIPPPPPPSTLSASVDSQP